MRRLAAYRQFWRNDGKIEAPDENSVVYFAQFKATGFIKIGWTTDPLRRVKVLEKKWDATMRLLGTMPGAQREEKAIQFAFQNLRVPRCELPFIEGKDEVFRPGSELLRFISRPLPLLARIRIDIANRVEDFQPFRLEMDNGPDVWVVAFGLISFPDLRLPMAVIYESPWHPGRPDDWKPTVVAKIDLKHNTGLVYETPPL